MRIMLIALVVILTAAGSPLAFQGMAPGPGVTVATGSSVPADGTVLFGATGTVLENLAHIVAPAEVYSSNMPYTASWAESASTTTCSKVNVVLRGWAGGNVKAILRGSDEAIIAQTQPYLAVYEDDGVSRDLTFQTPPTITKGASYYLTVLVDTDYAARIGVIDSSGNNTSYSTSSSYATPATGIDGASLLYENAILYIRCIK